MEKQIEEKQIEETTKILGCRMDGCEGCTYSKGKYPECAIKYTADEIYNAGYHKASEVAEDIVTKAIAIVGKIVTEHIESDNSLMETEIDIVRALAELKKKYTEEK